MFIKLIKLWLKINPNQNYYKKYKNTTNNAPQTPTCPKPKTETAEGSVKHVQSKQQRHQNNAIDIVVVPSSSTPTISHSPPQCPTSDLAKENVHWAIKISRENTPKVKPTEVCQEPNKQSQIYHKRNIIGSRQIQIIIFIIKNYYFIFRSITNKLQGSESTSVLLEYLKTYIHKVEFSVPLKNRKWIKITPNINN